MRYLTLCIILLIGGCGRTPPAPPASATSEPAPLRVVVDEQGDHATYTNTSAQPVWVLAYTPDRPLYHLETFVNPGGWKDYPIGWCGTGAERHEIAPGDRRRFRVVPDLAGEVWRVSVVYYTTPSGGRRGLAPSLVPGRDNPPTQRGPQPRVSFVSFGSCRGAAPAADRPHVMPQAETAARRTTQGAQSRGDGESTRHRS